MKTAVQLRDTIDRQRVGEEIGDLLRRLFPICRSATGNGNRETLSHLGELIPLNLIEVPSGSRVLDWTIPKEWSIRGAYLRGPDGAKVLDFSDSNVHVVGHSVPIRRTMPLSELQEHLHSLPDHPDWIPYRTSFYREDWGFCLADRTRRALEEGDYEVVIDSELKDGSLTYGECYLPGEAADEVLISTHICHPSLANDNLAGIVVAAFLARLLLDQPHRYSYRFVFAPGTIGAITWLARNQEHVSRIKHGLVATCLGDPGPFTYKRTPRGDAEIDHVVIEVLNRSQQPYGIVDFAPYGYDERQYCTPGFDLPVGSLTRTTYEHYPEYHTSADNLSLVRPEALVESLQMYAWVVGTLERNRRYLNLNPKAEPQLSRRGLYRLIGHGTEGRNRELALLWVLHLSNGQNSLLDIAKRSGMSFEAIDEAATMLKNVELLSEL